MEDDRCARQIESRALMEIFSINHPLPKPGDAADTRAAKRIKQACDKCGHGELEVRRRVIESDGGAVDAIAFNQATDLPATVELLTCPKCLHRVVRLAAESGEPG